MKNCPFCGRPIDFEEKYLKVVSCPYCNSILEFGSGELRKTGEQTEFIDFPSIFQIGKETDYNGLKVYVKGQLRYEYDSGFFDKFFVIINGKEHYIKENDGIITIFQEGTWQNGEIDLIDYTVGSNLNLLGKNIFVQETGIFKLINIRGYLNDNFMIGKEYEYLDGIGNGKMIFVEKDILGGKFRIGEEVNNSDENFN